MRNEFCSRGNVVVAAVTTFQQNGGHEFLLLPLVFSDSTFCLAADIITVVRPPCRACLLLIFMCELSSLPSFPLLLPTNHRFRSVMVVVSCILHLLMVVPLVPWFKGIGHAGCGGME